MWLFMLLKARVGARVKTQNNIIVGGPTVNLEVEFSMLKAS